MKENEIIEMISDVIVGEMKYLAGEHSQQMLGYGGSDVEDQTIIKGGPGSGNYGHEGRPGEVGGSGGSRETSGLFDKTDEELDFTDKNGDKLESDIFNRKLDKKDFYPGGKYESVAREKLGDISKEELEQIAKDDPDVIDMAVRGGNMLGSINKFESQNMLFDKLKDNDDFIKFAIHNFETSISSKVAEKFHKDTKNMTDRQIQDYLVKMEIRNSVDLWASTSGDSDPKAIAMQIAAKELLRDGMTDHMKRSLESPDISPMKKEMLKKELVYTPARKVFLQVQYDVTQKYLEENDIKEIVVYRGQEGKWSKLQEGRSVEIDMQPLSSFSLNPYDAESFADPTNDYRYPSKSPSVIASIVPASKIFAMPNTGIGCTGEDEVVLVGGKMRATVITGIPHLRNVFAKENLKSSKYFKRAVEIAGVKSFGGSVISFGLQKTIKHLQGQHDQQSHSGDLNFVPSGKTGLEIGKMVGVSARKYIKQGMSKIRDKGLDITDKQVLYVNQGGVRSGADALFIQGVVRRIQGTDQTKQFEPSIMLGNKLYNKTNTFIHEYGHFVDWYLGGRKNDIVDGKHAPSYFSDQTFGKFGNKADRETMIEHFADMFVVYVNTGTSSGYRIGGMDKDSLSKLHNHFDSEMKKLSGGKKRQSLFITKSKTLKKIDKDKIEFQFRETTSKYEKQFQKIMQDFFRDQAEDVLGGVKKAFNQPETKQGRLLSVPLGLAKAFPGMVFKGGPGSGSWEGPGDPRFARDQQSYAGESFYHGTIESRLQSILKDGLLLSYSGEAYPAFSKPGRVYISTDRKEAEYWAEHHAGITNTADFAVVEVRIPEEFTNFVIPDKNFNDSKSKTFLKDILKDWIVGAWVKNKLNDVDWNSVEIKSLKIDEGITLFVVVSVPHQIKQKSFTPIAKASVKASPNALEDRFDFSGWTFDRKKWNKRLQKEGGLFIKEMYDREGIRAYDGLRYWIADLAGAFNIDEPLVQEFLDNYVFTFAENINLTTEELLRGAMKAGMEEGLGMLGIASKIEGLYGTWDKWRSLLIARTETIRASNYAANEAYRQSGVVDGKEWLVTKDDRTCWACWPMQGKIVDLDKNFFNQGDSVTFGDGDSKITMKLDYEDVGAPPLHPNCRCVLVPWFAEEIKSLSESIGLQKTIKHLPGLHEQQDHGGDKNDVLADIDLPEFKQWFRGSKVITNNMEPKQTHNLPKGAKLEDANKAEPLIVFHGTQEEFSEFDKSKIGSHLDPGDWGYGFYFGTKGSAELYSIDYTTGKQGKTIPVYLSIKNPFVIKDDESNPNGDHMTKDHPALLEFKRMFGEEFMMSIFKKSDGEFEIPWLVKKVIGSKKFTEILQANGYDGFYRKFLKGGFEWVAFEPNQIKSIYNKGSFSKDNPDIYKSFFPIVKASPNALEDRFDFSGWTFDRKKSIGLQTMKHLAGQHDQSSYGSKSTHGNKEPMTEQDKQLKEVVGQMSKLYAGNRRLEGWKNASGYELIEKHGRFFEPAELPAGMKSGKVKECYRNASQLAINYPDKYTYVEGVSLSSNLPFPINHAFCIDNKTGKVVDPTWSAKNKLTVGQSYYGIAFSEKYLNQTLLRTEVYGMIPDYPTDKYNPIKNGFDKDAFKRELEKVNLDKILDKPKDRENYHYIEDYIDDEKLVKGLSSIIKGGPGSGNWEGPGNPRFAFKTSLTDVELFTDNLLKKYKISREQFDNVWGEKMEWPGLPASKALHYALARVILGKPVQRSGISSDATTARMDRVEFFKSIAKISKKSSDHFMRQKGIQSLVLYRGVPKHSTTMRKKNVTYWTASREMAQAYAGKNGNVYEGEFGLEHIIYSSETNPYTKKSMARMRAGRQGVKTSTDEFIVVSDPKIIKSIGKGVDVNWLDYSARRKLHKKELGLDNLVENQFINFGMVFLADDDDFVYDEFGDVKGLSSIIKGGPGSGIRGHRTNRHRKPVTRKPKFSQADKERLDKLQAEKVGRQKVIDIEGYSKDANEISHDQRMSQADLKDIKAQMEKNLKGIQKGQSDHQDVDGDLSNENSGTIRKNMNAELQSYSNYLAGDTALRARDYIDQFHKSIYQGIHDGSLRDINAKDIDVLGLDSVRKLIHQEVESNRQAFTDHGIRHIEGDTSRALKIAEVLNPKLTGKEALMVNFAMVNHDVGYTVPLIRAGGLRGVMITRDHPEFSEKIAKQQELQWDQGKIFSKDEYNKIMDAIRTHDSTDINGGNFLMAVRVSDNLSLFNEEKLPSMFKYVSGGDGILVQMGKAAKNDDKKAFESLRDELHRKIDKANLNGNLKRDLKAATKEISYVTPKFTLGVLAGYVSDVKKSGDKVDITIKHNAYDAKMQKIFDMGQKQTKKFLSDYGITEYDKTEYDIGGKINLKVEGYKGRGISGILPKRIGLGIVVKHLAGDHDQQSHAGESGVAHGEDIAGGESLIEASSKIGVLKRSEELDRATRSIKNSLGIDSTGNKKHVQRVLYERLKNDDGFKILSKNIQETWLSLGENPYRSDEGVVRLLVDAWAGTSADTDEISIAVQLSVEKEFGLKDAFLSKRDDPAQGWPPTLEKAQMMFEESEKGLRSFVRAQYEETQQYLKDKMINELILFRGVGTSAIQGLTNNQLHKGVNDRELKMMPISSFSLDPVIAQGFATSVGAVMAVIVPRERIFSTPRSGVGCTKEDEIVVLGGKMKVTVLNELPSQDYAVKLNVNDTWPLLRDIGRLAKEKSLGLQTIIRSK